MSENIFRGFFVFLLHSQGLESCHLNFDQVPKNPLFPAAHMKPDRLPSFTCLLARLNFV